MENVIDMADVHGMGPTSQEPNSSHSVQCGDHVLQMDFMQKLPAGDNPFNHNKTNVGTGIPGYGGEWLIMHDSHDTESVWLDIHHVPTGVFFRVHRPLENF